MPLILCDICQETFDITQFRFNQCGHGFCVECTKSLVKTPECALCRQAQPLCESRQSGQHLSLLLPRHPLPPHQVYITFDDALSPTDKADALAKRMESLASGRLTSAKPLGLTNRMAEIAGDTKIEKQTIERLLQITQSVQERLETISRAVQIEQDEKEALYHQVCELTQKNHQAHAIQLENIRLSAELETTRQQLNKSKVANHIMQEKTRATQQKLHAVETEFRNAKGLTDMRNLENADTVSKLQDALESKERELQLLKRKIRGLMKASRHNLPPQDADDSLIIV